MPDLHDAAHRAHLVERLKALKPEAQRQWGTMTPDQMLWHVSVPIALSLGEGTAVPDKIPIPRALLKFIVLNLPWGKNAPTNPGFVAKQNYDFNAEQARVLILIEKVASKSLDAPWPDHPAFGPMTGRQVSKLHAKHLHHHLTQFGA